MYGSIRWNGDWTKGRCCVNCALTFHVEERMTTDYRPQEIEAKWQ